eukprot:TRINITY_DN332_c2_g1_i1.p1 TRINITY_DN332_c2_g1~~TRINITY_DN332_c2_g1_i1.p1  ORF type:complete len:1099 (+),score=214.64 TRINITY_DN332_c2_g1_i1:49-3345(+)
MPAKGQLVLYQQEATWRLGQVAEVTEANVVVIDSSTNYTWIVGHSSTCSIPEETDLLYAYLTPATLSFVLSNLPEVPRCWMDLERSWVWLALKDVPAPPPIPDFVHAIDTALQRVAEATDSAIAFCGSSGSGKSTALVTAIQYVAQSAGGQEVLPWIMQACAVLAALTTASTPGNPSASLAPITVRLLFLRGQLVGATFQCRVLDLWRVCGPLLPGNRNVALFHQLACGADAELKARYTLRGTGSAQYACLVPADGAVDLQADAADAAALSASLASFAGAGLTAAQQGKILRLVTGFLLISNASTDGTEVRHREDVANGCALLQLDCDSVLQALDNHVADKVAFRHCLDTFCSHLYSEMVSTICGWLNSRAADADEYYDACLTLTDWPGAELSTVDSSKVPRASLADFSRYVGADAVLRALNSNQFAVEMEEYRQQGVVFIPAAVQGFEVMLTRHQKLETALMAALEPDTVGNSDVLDDDPNVPIARLAEVAAGRASASGSPMHHSNTQFKWRHVFGDLTYDIPLLEIENDWKLEPGLKAALNTSGFSELARCAQHSATATAYLHQTLADLLGVLHNVDCVNAVHCLSCGTGDAYTDYQRQFCFTGLAFQLQLRQAGLPVRLPVEWLAPRYRILLKEGDPHYWDEPVAVDDVPSRLMAVARLTPDEMHTSEAEVWLRASAFEELERRRAECFRKYVTLVQRWMRGVLSQRESYCHAYILSTDLRKLATGKRAWLNLFRTEATERKLLRTDEHDEFAEMLTYFLDGIDEIDAARENLAREKQAEKLRARRKEVNEVCKTEVERREKAVTERFQKGLERLNAIRNEKEKKILLTPTRALAKPRTPSKPGKTTPRSDEEKPSDCEVEATKSDENKEDEATKTTHSKTSKPTITKSDPRVTALLHKTHSVAQARLETEKKFLERQTQREARLKKEREALKKKDEEELQKRMGRTIIQETKRRAMEDWSTQRAKQLEMERLEFQLEKTIGKEIERKRAAQKAQELKALHELQQKEEEKLLMREKALERKRLKLEADIKAKEKKEEEEKRRAERVEFLRLQKERQEYEMLQRKRQAIESAERTKEMVELRKLLKSAGNGVIPVA